MKAVSASLPRLTPLSLSLEIPVKVWLIPSLFAANTGIPPYYMVADTAGDACPIPSKQGACCNTIVSPLVR